MTRRMTTTIGTLQQINETVQRLSQTQPAGTGGGLTEAEKEEVNNIVIGILNSGCGEDKNQPVSWAKNLFDCFQEQLPKWKCENVTINIDIVIIGWLLFNFYDSLKTHLGQPEITKIALDFGDNVRGKTVDELLHKPHATFFRDVDAFAKVIETVNTCAPLFRSAYDAAQTQPTAEAKKPNPKR